MIWHGVSNSSLIHYATMPIPGHQFRYLIKFNVIRIFFLSYCNIFYKYLASKNSAANSKYTVLSWRDSYLCLGNEFLLLCHMRLSQCLCMACKGKGCSEPCSLLTSFWFLPRDSTSSQTRTCLKKEVVMKTRKDYHFLPTYSTTSKYLHVIKMTLGILLAWNA